MDSGSSETMVPKALVRSLGLPTEKHPTLYKVGWIRKGVETSVTKCYKVPFSIDKFYKGEVLCNVLDIDACHLLLGRPWQYDVNAIH